MAEDDLDQALQADILANVFRMDIAEAGDLLEALALKLTASLPENTSVTRAGWMLSSKRPVQELTVRFDNAHLQIVREKHGSFRAQVMKVVRGVVLKTSEIPVDQWIVELSQQLAEVAERNATTRRALNKFVIG